jgi:hypothetical protein
MLAQVTRAYDLNGSGLFADPVTRRADLLGTGEAIEHAIAPMCACKWPSDSDYEQAERIQKHAPATLSTSQGRAERVKIGDAARVALRSLPVDGGGGARRIPASVVQEGRIIVYAAPLGQAGGHRPNDKYPRLLPRVFGRGMGAPE